MSTQQQQLPASSWFSHSTPSHPSRFGSLHRTALVLASILVASSAQAGPIFVQTEDPTHTSLCTLSDAVATANLGASNTGTPAGVGNCIWNGEATIEIESGKTYQVDSQLPSVTADMKIRGDAETPLATIARSSGSPTHRLLQVAAGARLELSRLALTQGHAVYGGAIQVLPGAELSASTVHFVANHASFQGGAIHNQGDVEILKCTFSGNSATWGGAILNSGNGTIDVSHSLFESNTSSSGGAIYQSGQLLIVERSTLSANAATWGGALYSKSGPSSIVKSTLRNNDASDAGSAVFAEWGSVEIGKSALTAEATQASLCFGSYYVTSTGDNALSDASCGTADAVVGPIAMSELVHHGGLTRLHAPLCDWSSGSCDSPLIDQYACPANERDQRDQFGRAPAGQISLGGALCDIGAYESICETGSSAPGNYTIMLYGSQIPSQLGDVILNNGSCATNDVDFMGQTSLCEIQWLVHGAGLGIRNILFLEDSCTYPDSQPIDCFANPDDCRDHCLLDGNGLPPYPLSGGGENTPVTSSYTLQAPTCAMPESTRYLIEFAGGELRNWDPELGAESGGGPNT